MLFMLATKLSITLSLASTHTVTYYLILAIIILLLPNFHRRASSTLPGRFGKYSTAVLLLQLFVTPPSMLSK